MKLLSDILVAGTAIRRFTSGMAEPDYDTNELTRRAVERAFEIIGEALRRVAVEFPATLDRISSARQAISFRNVLTHGYDIVEDPIVWSIVVKRLPALLTEVQTLMDEEAART